MLRQPEQIFVYKWYFWLISLTFIILGLINWQLPIFLISIPSVLSFHFAGLVNTICHRYGDKDFETKDNSFNNRWVNMITLGSGLHNTHHAYPNRWDNRTKKGDLDLPAVIIEKVFMINEVKK